MSPLSRQEDDTTPHDGVAANRPKEDLAPENDATTLHPRRVRTMRQTMRQTMRASIWQAADPELEALQKAAFKKKPWPLNMFTGFSTDTAKHVTLLGCLSSAVVLTVRLYLDYRPTAYFIHSIIVFFDMILIHMFTHSVFLSVTGEVLTYIHVLLFHFTKETVWELMETTLLAIITSIYMINQRKQALQERDHVTDDLDSLRERGALLLRNINQVHEAIIRQHQNNSGSMRESVMVQMQNEQSVMEQMNSTLDMMRQQDGKSPPIEAEKHQHENDDDGSTVHEESDDPELGHDHHNTAATMNEDTELTRALVKQGGFECSCPVKTFKSRFKAFVKPFQEHPLRKHKHDNGEMHNPMKEARDTFFEYFLDGAAGVMYTSFLGLIIDAFLSYGNSKY